MPVVELRPGPVYYYDIRNVGAPLDQVGPGTVTGSGAVWSDDLDSSFVDTEFQQQPGPALYSSTMSADFAPLNIPGATLNGLGYRVRGMKLDPGDVDARIWFSDLAGTRQVYQRSPWGPFMPTDPSTTSEMPFDFWDEDILGIGLRVSILALSPSSTLRPAWRCHEITLIVDYTAPTATATHAPPLRQTRRNDGLRGSVRSLRATSRQRSLRRGPGTIL